MRRPPGRRPDRPPGSRGVRRRGVSDAMGFVLVFGLMITTIGLVYLAGFDSMTTMRTGEQLQNSVRTFETIERNFDDIERRQAPSRAAEINLNGGTLLVDRGSTITVDVLGTGFNRTFTMGLLSHRLAGDRVEYENGAVVRASGEDSVVLTDATLACRSGIAIVSVVTLVSPNETVTGREVVTITAARERAGLVYPTNRSGPSPTGVEVTIASPNGAAWEAYLEEAPGWTDAGGGTYACSAAEVYVRQTVLEVSLHT